MEILSGTVEQRIEPRIRLKADCESKTPARAVSTPSGRRASHRSFVFRIPLMLRVKP